MRFVHMFVLTAVFTTLQASARAETLFPGAVARPNNRGDQVIFYYDVRDGFTTFLNLRNQSASALNVSILFYSGTEFGAPFTHTLTLPFGAGTNGSPGNGGLVIIDAGALRASGLPAAAGIAIATAVNELGEAIVTRGLSGNFTVANVATNSAWGSPAAARSAIFPPPASTDECAPNPPAPTLGSVVDGSTILFTPVQPATADLAAYYDPNTLAPASIGGNQLIFVTFVDVPGRTYAAASAETRWDLTTVRSNGDLQPPMHVNTSGVEVSDLVAVAGFTVPGSSGSILFSGEPRSAPLTRLVFFSESLGTFSTGYLLPRR
jgi:hypothetical protein